jgi:hypothetical protein
MKYLTIIVLIFLIGCEKEYYWEYVILNETSSTITITGYDRIDLNNKRLTEINSSVETIVIQPFKKFEATRARGLNGDPLGIFENMGIDSVNIVFNTEKMIIQHCEEPSLTVCGSIVKNITDYDNDYEKVKTGRSSKENEYRFTYTITQEDYNNAVPIKE